MTAIGPYLAGLLVVTASLFTLTSAIGLLRLPDLYTRMHAASKAGTMGSCVILLALAVSSSDWSISTRALAGIVFFLITVPISAHLLARAAHAAGYPLASATARDDLSADAARLVGDHEAKNRSTSPVKPVESVFKIPD